MELTRIGERWEEEYVRKAALQRVPASMRGVTVRAVYVKALYTRCPFCGGTHTVQDVLLSASAGMGTLCEVEVGHTCPDGADARWMARVDIAEVTLL